jgi:ethanolaminephosphotransferase
LITFMSTLQLRHEWRAIAGILYVSIPWWLAHWEEYHTGMMLYGNGLWGVTEANYAVVMVHYVTLAMGGAAWNSAPLGWLLRRAGAAEALPAQLAGALCALRLNDIFLLAFGCMGMGLLQDQVRRVFRLAGSKQLELSSLPPKEQGDKTLGRAAAGWHLTQILGTGACGAALLSLPVVARGHSRVVLGTFGITYAMQATRLIMAHMSKQPFSVAVWPLALMLAQVANHFAGVAEPFALAHAVHGVVLAGYLHYVITMVGEICAFLGIRALTIKPSAS